MKIIGIDPGLERCGWAIVTEQNKKPRLEAVGCIVTKRIDLAERLLLLQTELARVITTHQPTQAAVEELFFAKNTKTALVVAHARGVILVTLAQHKIPLTTFTPNAIKLAVCGNGHADKSQVQRMIKAILGLRESPKPDDAADAVAIALCGLQTKSFRSF